MCCLHLCIPSAVFTLTVDFRVKSLVSFGRASLEMMSSTEPESKRVLKQNFPFLLSLILLWTVTSVEQDLCLPFDHHGGCNLLRPQAVLVTLRLVHCR